MNGDYDTVYITIRFENGSDDPTLVTAQTRQTATTATEDARPLGVPRSRRVRRNPRTSARPSMKQPSVRRGRGE